jgi:hypothetical protein
VVVVVVEEEEEKEEEDGGGGCRWSSAEVGKWFSSEWST